MNMEDVMFKDPLMDSFEAGAKELEATKYKEFFAKHPLNTEGHKYGVLDHCFFLMEGGGIQFAVTESEWLPEQLVIDLQALFKTVYTPR
jgi:hypothetical protein